MPSRKRRPLATQARTIQRKWKTRRKRQLALPAGFHADGRRFASLEDVLDPGISTVDGAQLPDAQLVRLTVARIRRQKQFKLAMLDGTVIGKTKAIAAVRAQTELGRFLLEVERLTIELARETFSQGPPTIAQLRATQAGVEGRRRR